ncbi:MAG TPA: TIGR03086 family metal-binding protein [Humibacillus xanthopallidus]|nr:TIGR03086 family metal-binding protein [Humibacillus xanthopallidus]
MAEATTLGGPVAQGPLDTASLHRRSVEGWLATLEAVPQDRWDDPTPCRGWSVRDLVNHVVGEDLWTVPLLSGSTIEEVGDRFDGDVVGTDPKAAGRAAGREAVDASGALKSTGTVHLSYGEESADEYVRQLIADHLVHGWDLAAATGGDRTLDPVLVEAVAQWFDGRESLYRDGGAIGPRAFMTGDPRSDLLARFGRDAAWSGAHAAFSDFIAAFGRGDVDAIMALMTDDCVFEATGPAPDGVRHVGASAVREVWESLFGETGSPAFTEEESFVAGDRGVLRWRFDWVAPDGSPGHVRGVDVVRLQEGKVSEKLSYVKG